MPISQDQLESKLTASFEPEFLRVEDFSDGCGSKYNVFIVSKRFEGQSLLNRQRLVNETLKEEMNHIHALTQKCLTPEQWAKMLADEPSLADKKSNTSSADPNTKCINHAAH